MPLFDYKCQCCGKVEEHFVRPRSDLDEVFVHCGREMTKMVSAPHVATDYPPYECPVTGKMIEGRAAHRENLKRTGCRLFEPGEFEQYKRELPKKREQALEKAVDTAVNNAARDLGLNV